MDYAVNNCDCTFLCVIHENPWDEKTIGHLESELLKVSSTIIQVKHVKDCDGYDLIEVKFINPRSTETPVSIFYKYRNRARSLLLADPNEGQKPSAEDLSLVEDLFLTGLKE
jgi:hypothetical protein